MPITGVLDTIFKSYDVRGLCPEQLSAPIARRVGAGFARWLATNRLGEKVVLAGDMRPSTPGLIDALADGICEQGLDVVVAGLSSTDQLYFASGWLGLPGIQVTASHNPAQYNGMKMCRAMAAPIGAETGLNEIKALAAQELEPAARRGERTEVATLSAYADHLHSLVPLEEIRPLSVVVDAGNGMAGLTVPEVLGRSALRITPLYFELDGSFPNHPADPLDPANLVDLQRRVRAGAAPLRLAFAGGADPGFVVGERGGPGPASAITALIAERELMRSPGETIVHNVITSKMVPEVVRAAGGTPSRTKVGHSNMKARMAEQNAVFGGEHSAHYYFRDFYFADTGMLAAMHILSALGEQVGPLSELVARYDRYAASGEINSTVDDAERALRAVHEHATGMDAQIDRLDGITAELGDGAWFNVRASNTEPLLRLNVEAADPARMEQLRDELLAVIRR
ncbi:phosphomannomutase/phosphoglucomutase [Blastococcus sp. Marseille-P5729]|uniref:phosphomannomutase/phosphoglucomutase n=1 Tax=Blastococcus sp. Marseille-P5729 TaxID=2086582 RepID=UPI000D0F1B2A|nr:phosphomannomutase/phosphoglucomutase [Blastococcus sp. Marseille-P5729]